MSALRRPRPNSIDPSRSRRHPLLTRAVVVLLFFLASSTTLMLGALAEGCYAQAEPGDLGVFFDPGGTSTHIDPGAITPFDFFVVAFDTGGISGFELALDVYSSITVLNMTIPDNPLGCDPAPCGPDWIVGFGQCLAGSGPHVLLQGTAMYIVHEHNLTICATAPGVSSLDPPAPAWLNCLGETARFGVATDGRDYPDGCAIVSPTREPPVRAESASWGTLKSHFTQRR